jgi:hypothetical protein
VLFAIQNIAGISLVCWYEIAVLNEDDTVLTVLNIIDRLPSVGVGAAAITIEHSREMANSLLRAVRHTEHCGHIFGMLV